MRETKSGKYLNGICRFGFPRPEKRFFLFQWIAIAVLFFSQGSVFSQVSPDSSGFLIMTSPMAEDSLVNPGKLTVTPVDSPGKKLVFVPNDSTSKKKRKLFMMFKGQDKPEKVKVENRPRTAWHRSLVLPGWGQLYNKSAWKIPIIYAGFGFFSYFFYTNHVFYIQFKHYAIEKEDTSSIYVIPPEYAGYTGDNLRSARDFYRRYRDLNMILGVLWYALNIVDAFVEGHLDGFDVSDDLSLNVDPFMQRNQALNQTSYGLGFTLNLKNNPTQRRKPLLTE